MAVGAADADKNQVTLAGTVYIETARTNAVELAKLAESGVRVVDKIEVKPGDTVPPRKINIAVFYGVVEAEQQAGRIPTETDGVKRVNNFVKSYCGRKATHLRENHVGESINRAATHPLVYLHVNCCT